MKKLLLALYFFLILLGCQKKEHISPSSIIIAKWQPTNELQSLQADGSWSEWTKPSNLKILPTYEFTNKGRFLLDGEIIESCCQPGSFYKKLGDTLTFEYEKAPDCRTIKCADANTKIIVSLDEKQLILIESSGRYKIKYERIK